MNSLSLQAALIATAFSALIIFCERLFPFAVFGKRQPPKFITFIEKYIPSMIIAILIVYSIKDISVVQSPFGIPYLAGIIAAAVLHLTIKNSMVSIFGSTAIFIILSHLL